MPNPRIEVLLPFVLTDLQIQALNLWLATVCKSVTRRRPFERRNQRHAEYMRERREFLDLRLQLWQDETPNLGLRAELSTLDMAISEKRHQVWEVAVNNGSQFGVNQITMALRPYLVDVQAYEPLRWDDETTSALELENLYGVLGFLPKTRLEIAGIEDRSEDHLLCAFMAADLLSYYEGAYAKLWLKPVFHTPRGAAEWQIDDSRHLASTLAGQLYEIAYGRRENPKIYHLVDAEALQDWANHPKFFLHSS